MSSVAGMQTELGIRLGVGKLQARLNSKPQQVFYAKVRTLIWTEWDLETQDSDICVSSLTKLETILLFASPGLQIWRTPSFERLVLCPLLQDNEEAPSCQVPCAGLMLKLHSPTFPLD